MKHFAPFLFHLTALEGGEMEKEKCYLNGNRLIFLFK